MSKFLARITSVYLHDVTQTDITKWNQTLIFLRSKSRPKSHINKVKIRLCFCNVQFCVGTVETLDCTGPRSTLYLSMRLTCLKGSSPLVKMFNESEVRSTLLVWRDYVKRGRRESWRLVETGMECLFHTRHTTSGTFLGICNLFSIY